MARHSRSRKSGKNFRSCPTRIRDLKMKKVFVILVALMAVMTSMFAQVKVDEKPLFNGKPAEEGFRKYVGISTNYPPIAMENGTIGRVFVEFCIERDGSVSNVKIIGSEHPVLDNEVLRVINGSPNWTPGKKNGHPVRMSYTFPINFSFGEVNNTSFSKKVKLSKKTILLEELNIIGFNCCCGGIQKK
jgi:TonB family protein